jgi:hypothetical protein
MFVYSEISSMCNVDIKSETYAGRDIWVYTALT